MNSFASRQKSETEKMPKTYSSIWIHAVWSTKYRLPILSQEFRFELFRRIKLQCKKKKIHLDIINGTEDHVHCLIRLKTTQSTALIIKEIKGSSSRWINENELTQDAFAWQEGYGVFSVSQIHINNVRAYIYNQEKHHANRTYEQEIRTFMINQRRNLFLRD